MKTKTRIQGLAGLGVLLTMACGSTGVTAKSPTDLSGVTLRVAEQVKGLSTLLQASGELKGVPYNLEWSEFAAAAPQLQALGAGAADVAFSGDAPAINAIGAGAPIKIVAATQPVNSSDYAGLSILVKKNSPIRTLADLKGRSISPTTQGSIAHQLLLAALAKGGLTPSQVKIVLLNPADARAAFNAGSIDAWSTWDPYVATAQLVDDARILSTSQGLSPRFGFVDATNEAIKDPARHAAIQDLINRMARAYSWAAAHVADWAATYSSSYNIPAPVARMVEERSATRFVALDKSVTDALQGIADLYAKNGVLQNRIEVGKAFDHSFEAPTAVRAA